MQWRVVDSASCYSNLFVYISILIYLLYKVSLAVFCKPVPEQNYKMLLVITVKRVLLIR